MRIYRLEKKGAPDVGPFQGSYSESLYSFELDTISHFNTFPSMGADSDLDWSQISHYYCGCHSLDLLREWFSLPAKTNSDVRDRLGRYYLVAVFEVPDAEVRIGRSGKQCFFQRMNHEPVSTYENPLEILS